MGGSLGGRSDAAAPGVQRGTGGARAAPVPAARVSKHPAECVCGTHTLWWDLPAEKLPQKMQVQPCSTAERGFVEVAVEFSGLACSTSLAK